MAIRSGTVMLTSRRANGWTELLLLLVILISCQACAPAHSSKLIVLVRHAERALEPPADPVLTAQGDRRAQELAQRLADTRIDHIITSHLARTLLTAQYVANDRQLEPEIVPVTGGVEAHIIAVTRAIHARPPGEAILVVGHSNTIPAIVHELGGPDLPDLTENAYSDLFILLIDWKEDTRTIRASFD